MEKRKSTKNYRRCDCPGWRCRQMIPRGQGIRVQESGRSSQLRFSGPACHYHYAIERNGKRCVACQRLFDPGRRDGKAVVCPDCSSPEGVLALTREAMGQLPTTVVGQVCQWCRENFAPASLSYCSKACKEAAHNFRVGRYASAINRGAYMGEPGKPLVTAADACALHADRDCWKGCGRALVDLTGVLTGSIPDDAWTSDHVIPIRIGGMHAWFNLAPACWTCNRTRPRDGTDICLWYSRVSDRREFGSERAAMERGDVDG